MPIPVIIVLSILEAISLLGIPCFIYEYNHGHLVPEMPRYAGREREWWWTAVLGCLAFVGVGYVFIHVKRIIDSRKR